MGLRAGNRMSLGSWPTPIHRARRLEAALGVGPLLIKRDDLAGFVAAGNKTRPLEYLISAALEQGCDAVVTGGRPDSNFCAATAAAASAAGLTCHLVMVGAQDRPELSDNMRLASRFAAIVHHLPADTEDIDDAIARHAQALISQGNNPYWIPRGGSTGLGAMGFADAAAELDAQLLEAGVEPGVVVCAVGSGGTYAGLLTGARQQGWRWPVLGASVSRPLAEISNKVLMIASECARLRAVDAPSQAEVRLVDARGAGHGRLSAEQAELAELALVSEGLLLDASYTAKSFELAVQQARDASKPTVFWHTGGTLAAMTTLLSRRPN